MRQLRLEDLPNVGPVVASKLRLISIYTPSDLVGRDPYQMFEELNARTAGRHDPCLLDVFIAVTRHVSGKPARPWWSYTAERKEKLSKSPGQQR